jgi:hypothetical protein
MTTDIVEAPQVASDSRNLAALAHLSAFITFVGIPSLIGPLVFMLAKRDDPYVAEQAKEALNFNLSFLIYGLVAAVSMLLLIGFILLPVVAIAWFVLVIVATVKAANGEAYRYPYTMRLVS